MEGGAGKPAYHLLVACTHQEIKALLALGKTLGAEEPSSGFLLPCFCSIVRLLTTESGHQGQTAYTQILIFFSPALMAWPWPGKVATPGLRILICQWER